MKALFTIFVVLVLTSTVFGQPEFHSKFEENAFISNDPLQIIISSHPEVDQNKFGEILEELDGLTDKLFARQNDFSDDVSFLEWAFYYVHRKKLGWYDSYVSFSDIFLSKKYDCLTGSILYAYLLDQLGYKFSIYELDYHIFLVAHLPGQNVLLEATDPLNGYVSDSTMIRDRVNDFIADGNNLIEIETVGGSESSSYSTVGAQSVNFHKLAGLQYYNLAIKACAEKQYREAESNIKKAERLYPSRRIISVKELMLSVL